MFLHTETVAVLVQAFVSSHSTSLARCPSTAHSWAGMMNGDLDHTHGADDVPDLWPDAGFSSSDSDEEEETPTPAEPKTWTDLTPQEQAERHNEFVRFMSGLVMKSQIPSTTFCAAMYHAGRAGIHPANTFGLQPDSSSGHYSRKVKKKLGWGKSADFYDLDVVGHAKHDLERTVHVVPTIPAHEQMSEDLKHDKKAADALRARLGKEGGLPPSYYEHPVVRGAQPDELVWPIAIYLDGVPYSHTDGVIGFWFINLISGNRYLPSILRKRHMCQCGCRGWCTFFTIFLYLKWSLSALKDNTFPSDRHDSSAWLKSDKKRAALSGKAIGGKCACIYIKGDWMEFATTMALTTWMDATRPCYECNAFGEWMYCTDDIELDGLPWALNDEDDYFLACKRCEHSVQLLGCNDVEKIMQFLKYDKRKDGAHGMALVRDLSINGVELKANDRLEPSASLTDVGALESIEKFPATIIFWRSSADTITRHRNPIFDKELGVTTNRSLTVDVLHSFYLGVLNVWARTAIWQLILSGIYGQLGTKDENMAAAVLMLRSALMAFYTRHHAENPKDKLTRVADLTVKMLGKSTQHRLKTKGAETWGVALFLISELQSEKAGKLDDRDRLLLAGQALEKVVRTWQGHDWTIPRPACQENAHAQSIWIKLASVPGRLYMCGAGRLVREGGGSDY